MNDSQGRELAQQYSGSMGLKRPAGPGASKIFHILFRGGAQVL
jgi:hypothetical protein